MRASERKPAWLKSLCEDARFAGLHDVVCPSCRLWVCECRDGVWQRWDCLLLHGGDVTVAVVLGVPLMRVRRVPGHALMLTGVCGERGLDAHGEYLAAHRCGMARIGTMPYRREGRARSVPMRWPKGRLCVGCADPWGEEPFVDDVTSGRSER